MTNQPVQTAGAGAPSRNRSRRRRWIPYAGVVLLAGLITAGLWPKPLPIETAPALRGPLRVVVSEEGKTRIRQRHVVSSPVPGQLRRIPYKAGELMTAGESVVAVIDPLAPTPLDARTRQATQARRATVQANLERAQVASQFAASDRRRAEQLYAGKTLSLQELEVAQLRDAASLKELAAAESALRQVEAELAGLDAFPTGEPRELRAPVSGRVLRVFEENSRVVQAGTPLVEIGDPVDLEAVIEVLSRDGARILGGARAELHQWGGGPPLEGKVRLVEPAGFTKISALGVEEQRVNVIVDLVTPPDQRAALGDNFRVEAQVVVWESADVLKVPAGALFRHGDEWAVFVLENNRARLRTVKAGRSSGTEIQILEGLNPGDPVLLYPGSRVQNGSRVRRITI